jgi:hypothetical protein
MSLVQKEDSPDPSGGAAGHRVGVGGTRSPRAYCLQVSTPLCEAVVGEPAQAECRAVMDKNCHSGTPFLNCLIGSNSGARGARGFMQECLCAPQSLVATTPDSGATAPVNPKGIAVETDSGEPHETRILSAS